jgi:pterin-4a-carbinolamine dehydratase
MKISSLMQDYFEDRRLLSEAPGRDLPISPKEDKWERIADPESIRRTFAFTSHKNVADFLADVLQMQDEMGHQGKMLVDGNRVKCQVTTDSLQRITELDVEWAAAVDEIYKNVESVR